MSINKVTKKLFMSPELLLIRGWFFITKLIVLVKKLTFKNTSNFLPNIVHMVQIFDKWHSYLKACHYVWVQMLLKSDPGMKISAALIRLNVCFHFTFSHPSFCITSGSIQSSSRSPWRKNSMTINKCSLMT